MKLKSLMLAGAMTIGLATNASAEWYSVKGCIPLAAIELYGSHFDTPEALVAWLTANGVPMVEADYSQPPHFRVFKGGGTAIGLIDDLDVCHDLIRKVPSAQ